MCLATNPLANVPVYDKLFLIQMQIVGNIILWCIYYFHVLVSVLLLHKVPMYMYCAQYDGDLLKRISTESSIGLGKCISPTPNSLKASGNLLYH